MARLWSSLLLPCFFSMMFLVFFPVDAIYKNDEFFILSYLVFIVINIVIGLCCYLFMFSISSKRHAIVEPYKDIFIAFNFKLLSFLIITGGAFLIYDRLIVRGIDYLSLDIRSARYAWLASDGGGFFGVLGNLLIPFSYVGVYFSLKFISNNSKKLFLICISISGIVLHSFLNGGRSNIFLLLVLLVSFYVMSDFKISKFIFNKYFVFIVGVMVGLILYVFNVISSSAAIGGVDLKEILWLGAIELYGRPNPDFFNETYSDFVYLVLYSLMYIFHGQWTHQALFELNQSDIVGFHFLAFAPTIFLDKIGVIDLALQQRAFSDTGAFITLIGAVLYDFGWFGLVVFSIFTGCFFGYCLYIKKIKRGRHGFLSFFVQLNVISLLILSPVLSVYGFAYFSFIIWAFFVYWVINLFVFRISKTL